MKKLMFMLVSLFCLSIIVAENIIVTHSLDAKVYGVKGVWTMTTETTYK